MIKKLDHIQIKYNYITIKKIFFFIILLLIIFYRSPYIFIEGRFLEEEGSIWYRNLFLNGQFDTLIFVSNFSGYLNLWMNIASFFSGFVDIYYAPLVTVYFSFILLVYIFFYILNSTSLLFVNDNSKLLGCMIILFSPVMTAEVWMNSLNAMSYLGILAFLILFEKDYSKFRNINFIVLLISGLSGYYSSALAPVFLIKYFYFKNKTNLINFLIIFVSSLTQFSITIYSKMISEIASERFIITYEKLINYSYNVILKSLFGREIIQKIISIVKIELLLPIFILTILIVIISLFKVIIDKKDRVLNLILISFLIESLLIIFGSAYKDFVGGRYSVCVGIICSFIILRLYYLYKERSLKFLYAFLITIFLSTGFLEYKMYNMYPHFLSCIDCPEWKDEVNKWKVDKNYNLKIWTYPNQSMKLY
tara:strand:+ start:1515 stop:2777 length:1263 start_codon:yes stop_codon:yes gene_type:complete